MNRDCLICCRPFKSNDRTVQRIHQNCAEIYPIDKMNACDHCDKMYKRRANLVQHEKNVHGIITEYYCKLCLNEVPRSSKKNIEVHIKRAHEFYEVDDLLSEQHLDIHSNPRRVWINWIGVSYVIRNGASEDSTLPFDRDLAAGQVNEAIMATIRNSKRILLDIVGRGGLGECFIVGQNTSSELVYKVMNNRNHGDVFKKEIEIQKLCNHIRVVQLIEAFVDGEFNYMIMPFYGGGTLSDLLLGPKMTRDECTQYTLDILKGLMHIHSLNIVHRDIKHANIFLDLHKSAKIGDFGLAEYHSVLQRNQKKLSTENKKRRKEEPAGSLDYLAPEILANNDYSFASDIWAVGVIHYSMICRVFPFDDASTLDINSMIPYDFQRIPDDKCHNFVLEDIFVTKSERLTAESFIVAIKACRNGESQMDSSD